MLDLTKHGDQLDHILNKFLSYFNNHIVKDEWFLLAFLLFTRKKKKD